MVARVILQSVVVLLGIFLPIATPDFSRTLRVVMLDIGQGDAFYIRTPLRNDILIDGGPDRTLLSELGSVMPLGDHHLEIVIATHDDQDHIGGLLELCDAYTIGTLFRNPEDHPTVFAAALDTLACTTGVQETYRGDRIDIEKDLWLEILHPLKATRYDETNHASLVMMLHYRDITMMFTGDAPNDIEREVLSAGHDHGFHVDLLKVGHHGSHTSTSWVWGQALQPTVALVSAGKNNRYGHPHAAPLLRLQRIGAQIFRTDRDGRVLCRSDGFQISCEVF